jgi:pyruvate, water dikinase
MLSNLNLFKRWKTRKPKPSREDISAIFRVKYSHFKELLASNTELLNIITDIEEKLQGHRVFGMSYVRSQSARCVFRTLSMVQSLDALSRNRYPTLFEVLENINAKIKQELEQRREVLVSDLILPYAQINREMVDWVGGKSANLGEVLTAVRLPVPEGFAITTHAFEIFLAHNDLVDEINKQKMELNPDDPETLNAVSEEIQRLIISARVPAELEDAILTAYAQMTGRLQAAGFAGDTPRVSMRSSAIGEDSELSFAGQYLSLLNVSREQLIQTYKFIVASLYTPRAISYRLNMGIRDEDISMSVACLQMVDSVASGVMYSHHPYNPSEDHILINAVWGLGPYAVDGHITPDMFTVAKDAATTLLEARISPKAVQLVSNPDGGLMEIPVPAAQQEAPCLTPEQIKILADYALKLEKHYCGAQDIEWALDSLGRLLVLQTRPLLVQAPEGGDAGECLLPVPGYTLLLDHGAAAYPGVGCGPAFLVRSEEDLLHFPDGAILVAKHSSPKFVVVMQKAQAIVTDSGSVTGHMASLCREFNVPSVLDAKGATSTILPGMEITVDAHSGRIYQGKVPELLALRHTREPYMKGTPVYQTLRQVADLIVPLNLIDPKSPTFSPENCRSIHDIMRFIHERSYGEMFQISDIVSDVGAGSVKLDAPIALDLYMIDLGEGIAGLGEHARKAKVGQIVSVPFKALLKGMLHEELRAPRPRPVEFSGFFSVMREQMLTSPTASDRFGDRSYAIISDKYLNFSSRVGYHYSVLDSYCGQTTNKNYITFSFKGGAADDVRRSRRVRAIAIVLVALDFSVDVQGDRVDARFQKYECPVIEEKLESVGRLLQFTRQMDMLMTTENSVELVAKNFLEGNYHYD